MRVLFKKTTRGACLYTIKRRSQPLLNALLLHTDRVDPLFINHMTGYSFRKPLLPSSVASLDHTTKTSSGIKQRHTNNQLQSNTVYIDTILHYVLRIKMLFLY